MDALKVNIVFFYESINNGGQQTQTYNLTKTIRQLGHNVSWVYLFGNDLKKIISQEIALFHIPVTWGPRHYFRLWKLIFIINKLTNYCKKENTRFIISGSGIGSVICGIVAMRLNIRHYRLIGCSLKQVEKTLFKFYKVFRIDSLIDGYFGWPAVFLEIQEKGVSKLKCFELNAAVDTKIFYPLKSKKITDFREKLGINSNEIVIGWIGRVAENMQVGNTVILGRELIKLGFTSFKILIVGGGPWLNSLRKITSNLGLDNYTIFSDWVPMNQVNSYINSMDVIPLLEQDPHGGSILRESMSCGKVTISVDGPSKVQRDFMKPSFSILLKGNDFIKEAAKTIIRLSSDPEIRKTMGKKARLYCKKHLSFNSQAKSIQKVLDESI